MNRSDILEEMTGNLEDIAIKTIQNKAHKEKRFKKMIQQIISNLVGNSM